MSKWVNYGLIILIGTTQIIYSTHVMRKDTYQEIVPETKDLPRQTKRRGIMVTLLKRMNQKRKEQKKIPQVMRNMNFNPEGFNP